MKYIAETPFEIGAKVWQANYGQRHYEYTCPVCKGTGTLTNCDGESVKCLECYGHKTKGATAQDWYPEEKIIQDIVVRFIDCEIIQLQAWHLIHLAPQTEMGGASKMKQKQLRSYSLLEKSALNTVNG